MHTAVPYTSTHRRLRSLCLAKPSSPFRTPAPPAPGVLFLLLLTVPHFISQVLHQLNAWILSHQPLRAQHEHSLPVGTPDAVRAFTKRLVTKSLLSLQTVYAAVRSRLTLTPARCPPSNQIIQDPSSQTQARLSWCRPHPTLLRFLK